MPDDPRWKDYVLFFEYFHSGNGAGLGAASRADGRRGRNSDRSLRSRRRSRPDACHKIQGKPANLTSSSPFFQHIRSS